MTPTTLGSRVAMLFLCLLSTAHPSDQCSIPYVCAEVYGQKRGNKLAEREELSQEERRAERKRKKRVHARKTAEREEQQKLQVAILGQVWGCDLGGSEIGGAVADNRGNC